MGQYRKKKIPVKLRLIRRNFLVELFVNLFLQVAKRNNVLHTSSVTNGAVGRTTGFVGSWVALPPGLARAGVAARGFVLGISGGIGPFDHLQKVNQ